MPDLALNPTRMLTVTAAATAVWTLVGCNLSSPQTAELNAGARSETIGKWTGMTWVEAGAWIVFFCWLDRSLWPAVGGILAGATMAAKYKYAIASGLASTAAPTESY
jgi:hypothetical protein